MRISNIYYKVSPGIVFDFRKTSLDSVETSLNFQEGFLTKSFRVRNQVFYAISGFRILIILLYLVLNLESKIAFLFIERIIQARW